MKSLAVILASFGFATAVPFASSDAWVFNAELSELNVTESYLEARAGSDAVPAGTYLETHLDTSKAPITPGATFSKIRQGPFTVRAMSALENRPVMNVQKPCSNCYVVAIEAGLEFPDGRIANIADGAWLHHMVLYNNAIQKRDPTCPLSPQRLFASGNERTPVRINGKYKYGIKLDAGDMLGMIIDLMNESSQQQTFYLTMTYEHLPVGASGYKPASMAWLDVAGNCLSTSEVPAREGSYTLRSQPWSSTVNGRLLSATGHGHDGVTMVTVFKNGQKVCSSPQIYGRREGYAEKGNMAGMANMGAMTHVSDTGSCIDFSEVRAGDRLNIEAQYNSPQHPLMKKMSGSGLEPIMGISQVYIGT